MTSETQLILEKLDNMDNKITAMDAKLTNVEKTLRKEIAEVRTELKEEIQEVRTELKEEIAGVRTELTEKIEGVRTELKEEIAEVRTELKEEIQEVRTGLKDVQITLESEIHKNILIIAEGHQELNRKLDEALKVENEKEILLIRVNHLENELRKVKLHIPEIA